MFLPLNHLVRARAATQAVSLLINHLFSTTSINRIQATVVVGNDVSSRVLEKAGMQKDGIYRGIWFLHGTYRDMYMHAIIRSDWGNEQSYRQRHEF